MNENRAVEIMTGWLAHKNELGKEPAQIQAAGRFSYEENEYVIVKFKPEMTAEWQVGVVGFDEEGNECGHTFSEYEEYDNATAKDRCIAMIEYLKDYWRSRARAELLSRGVTEEEVDGMTDEERMEKWKAYMNMTDEERKRLGVSAGKLDALRIGFVLLEDADIDFDAVVDRLEQAFGIEDEHSAQGDHALVFEKDGNMITVSMIETPVPNKEAEYYAEANFLWQEAVEAAKRHKAHLLVSVKNLEGDPITAACFFTDTVNLCAQETDALGIYTTGNVYEPEYYDQWTGELRKNRIPMPLWVYVGLIQGEGAGKNSGYTYGLTAFGRPEIEVIESAHTPQEIYNFLYNVCDWLLSENMYFCDGETLSFTSDQRLTVTRSAAVYVEGESFKIKY